MYAAPRSVRHRLLDVRFLWIAFLGAQVLLTLINIYGTKVNPIGDIKNVYIEWARQALSGNFPGVTVDFVYPVFAMAPVLLAAIFGLGRYIQMWFVMAVLLNCIGMAILLRDEEPFSRDRRIMAGWVWTLLTYFLGPIALSRIDSITVPMAVVAVVWLSTRPRTASALLALATWIKIWPVAVITIALVSTTWRKTVFTVGAVVSAILVGASAIFGGFRPVLSFVTQQTGRSIQIESTYAVLYNWGAVLRVPGFRSYYNRQILTVEVAGPGVNFWAAASTPIQALAAFFVVGITLLIVRQRRPDILAQLLPLATLGLVLALIVFNKVGSPQFMCWLVAPLLLGVLMRTDDWFPIMFVCAGATLLTQQIYPYFYSSFFPASAWLVFLQSAKMVLLLIAFCMVSVRLVRLYRSGVQPATAVVESSPAAGRSAAVEG
ncbi:hypothetical protein KEM60_01308 [Austwickia sp. TVS 96-490-7B]|uniref:glycosyltransferase 87 family protein n=1 Tax=Austwickia sp. TVS 96-490-7B TaxID=2830843 RepID=UPI001C5943A1|nr:glycosyltransferase 87 family protein [Austwickia sp. TVS 96-490-7B]MBW3085114.1 hypothetical protein [Austwickia sp. TVS 96-490-7B]